LQVRQSFYSAEKQNIGVAMTNQLNDAFYKQYAGTIEAKAKANLAAEGISTSDSNYPPRCPPIPISQGIKLTL